jgi:hypothetical protein
MFVVNLFTTIIALSRSNCNWVEREQIVNFIFN